MFKTVATLFPYILLIENRTIGVFDCMADILFVVLVCAVAACHLYVAHSEYNPFRERENQRDRKEFAKAQRRIRLGLAVSHTVRRDANSVSMGLTAPWLQPWYKRWFTIPYWRLYYGALEYFNKMRQNS